MGQKNISLCRHIGGSILVCRALKSLRTTVLKECHEVFAKTEHLKFKKEREIFNQEEGQSSKK